MFETPRLPPAPGDAGTARLNVDIIESYESPGS